MSNPGEERPLSLDGSDPRLPSGGVPFGAIPPHILEGGNGGSSSASSSEQLSREPGDGQEQNLGLRRHPPPPAPSTPQSPPQRRWEADPELLSQIINLGFGSVAAEKALFYTSNASADAAVGWILDNPAAAEDNRPLVFEGFSSSGENSDSEYPAGGAFVTGAQLLPEDRARMASLAHKMVHVVNGGLKMGLGKVAAQVGHGTLGLYRELVESGGAEAGAALAAWRENGEAKIVLRAESDDEMRALAAKAAELGIPAHEVRDAGLTQIAAGSFTVLSLFDESERVDRVTRHLKLLD